MNPELAPVWAGLRSLYRRWCGHGVGGCRVLELDGVLAGVCPLTPDRSVVNGVVPDSAEALESVLDELARAYEAAGVRAWTVWVPKSDERLTRLLEEAGHAHDADPAVMVRDLDEVPAPTLTGVELSREPDLAAVAALNDEAYPASEDNSWRPVLEAAGAAGQHFHLAYEGDRPVSCVLTHDVGEDAHIELVATSVSARGRGLAGGLLLHALADARERGMRTSSLEATKAGEPLYARLGYRLVEPVVMWERRSSASPSSRAITGA